MNLSSLESSEAVREEADDGGSRSTGRVQFEARRAWNPALPFSFIHLSSGVSSRVPCRRLANGMEASGPVAQAVRAAVMRKMVRLMDPYSRVPCLV